MQSRTRIAPMATAELRSQNPMCPAPRYCHIPRCHGQASNSRGPWNVTVLRACRRFYVTHRHRRTCHQTVLCNCANYFSKHHPASHHQAIRSTYLYAPTNSTKNYFDCLADTAATTPLATTNHVRPQGRLLVDPGEGVLFSPGNPEGHCDCVQDYVTMTKFRATQIASQL